MRADVLALGYGRFVPRLAGVRAEMDDSGWHTQLALDGGDAIALQPLWQAMPMGAEISFASSDPAALQALHDWFAAQLHDHGAHAMTMPMGMN